MSSAFSLIVRLRVLRLLLIILLGLSFSYSFILIISLILVSAISWIEFNGLISKVFKPNLNILFIINADSLEKKSKLRNFFEKEKELICVAFCLVKILSVLEELK